MRIGTIKPDSPAVSAAKRLTLHHLRRAAPILDCCIATAPSSLQGVYTLTATTRNHTAHVPPPDQQDTGCTSFTSELQNLIRCGIPHKPPQLTLGDIYPILRQRLLAKGLPAPNQRGTDSALQFPFTANAAKRQEDKETAVADSRERDLRVLADLPNWGVAAAAYTTTIGNPKDSTPYTRRSQQDEPVLASQLDIDERFKGRQTMKSGST